MTFLTGVGGEFLHPGLVNVDVVARANYAAYKTRQFGGDASSWRLCIELGDDSVDTLSKSELFERLDAPHQWSQVAL